MEKLKSEQAWEIIDSHTELIRDLFQLIKDQEEKIKSLSEKVAELNEPNRNVLDIDEVGEQSPLRINQT